MAPPGGPLYLRIGTRGSRLALAQARHVKAAIESHHQGAAVELKIIKTSGDKFADAPLAALGGKGLFVKEIEAALLAGSIDVAVHSMKDLPAEVEAGLVIAAVPRREDPGDVLVTQGGQGLDALPAGARVGTTSLRRAALLRARRADLQVVALRGNVDTRLRKLGEGQVDAIVLAAAGLKRLGITVDGVELDRGFFVPAIGQGALAIETRDDGAREAVAGLDDPDSRVAVEAERGFMRGAGGSCLTPLAAHATVDRGTVRVRGVILSPDGARSVRAESAGARGGAGRLGAELAAQLLAAGGAEILQAVGVEA